MATVKTKTVWFCKECGNESPKWMGKCPACGEWNTMVEETVATGKKTAGQASITVPGSSHKPPHTSRGYLSTTVRWTGFWEEDWSKAPWC